MTPHLMRDIADLDCFSPEQIDLTRRLDEDEGGERDLVTVTVIHLSTIHTAFSMVGLPRFQRAAYEANQLHKKTGKKTDLIAAEALWRVVLYMQAVWEGVERDLADPEIRKLTKEVGEKIGFDILGKFDREKEE